MKSNAKVIVAGDMNAKHPYWNCYQSNNNGRALKKYIDNKDYLLLYRDRPTFYPSNTKNRPSTIDLAIAKNIGNIKIDVLNELDSDHLPILIDLNAKIKTQKQREFLNYARADWSRFRNYVNNNFRMITQLKSTADINKAVDSLTKVIQEACKISIPKIKNKINTDVLDEDTITLIKIRNNLRRKFQRNKNPAAKCKLNRLSKLIKRNISIYRNTQWEKRLRKLTPKDNSLWKLSKYFTRKSDNKIPSLQSPNKNAITNKEKANLLADHFESVHWLTEDFGESNFNKNIKNISRSVNNLQANVNEIEYPRPAEIIHAIKNFKSKKAPGPDGIQNIVLVKIVLAILYKYCQ